MLEGQPREEGGAVEKGFRWSGCGTAAAAAEMGGPSCDDGGDTAMAAVVGEGMAATEARAQLPRHWQSVGASWSW